MFKLNPFKMPVSGKFEQPVIKLPAHTLRALKAVSLMTIALVILAMSGFLTDKTFLIHRAFKCITLPIILFFYLNRPNPKIQELYGEISPVAIGWTFSAFFFTMIASFNFGMYGFFATMIFSTFIYVNPKRLFLLLLGQKQAGLTIALGALSGPVLVMLHRMIWLPFATLSLYIMNMWMMLFYNKSTLLFKEDVIANGHLRRLAKYLGIIGGKYGEKGQDFVAISSQKHFLYFTPGNNYMNAVFLGVFLLALLLVAKEQYFKHVSLGRVTIIMLAAIVFLVPLGMTLTFVLSQIGHARHADPLMKFIFAISSKKAGPVWGWLGYLILEVGFLYAIYWRYGRAPTAKDKHISNKHAA